MHSRKLIEACLDPSLLDERPGTLEPIFLSIKRVSEIMGEGEWRTKELLALGAYEAKKSGRRTLITFESVKRRAASLPAATFAKRKPRKKRQASHLAEA